MVFKDINNHQNVLLGSVTGGAATFAGSKAIIFLLAPAPGIQILIHLNYSM
jgi:hypothetical protein